MPIIINGGSYCAGGWWANHLQKAETNERVEIVGFSNLSAENIPDAFREMQALAAGTRCTNYFYQANINPRADEHLTPQQRDAAIETLERNLGLTGQPRFVVEHQKEGRTHWHVVWSRIDTDRMRAISDSHTAVIHERTSRELEIKFGLEPGISVLEPQRERERPERRPRKSETFRAAESGVDVEKVKADARAAWKAADSGQSFRAALEASGEYVLARGDRRDFVIVDRTGDDHSLARRLGVKTAEMRARMADLNPASLPSVDEARTLQVERHQKAAQEPRQRAEPSPGTELPAKAPLHAPEVAVQAAAFAAPAPKSDLRAPGRAAGRLLDGFARAAERITGLVLSWAMAEPQKTAAQMQQERQAAGNVETRHAAAYAEHVETQHAEHADRTEAQKKAQQEGDLRLARTLGILATQESSLNRSEDERPREREERERER